MPETHKNIKAVNITSLFFFHFVKQIIITIFAEQSFNFLIIMASEGETKSKILRKTFELLLQKGCDGVSISDIQHAAGISRGLLYHHYKNKEELFLIVIEHYFVDLFWIDNIKTKSFTIPQMISFMEQKNTEIINICALSDGKKFSFFNYDYLFYEAMSRYPEFAAKYRKVRDDELKIWEKVVDNSIKNKLVRDDINVKTTAKIFMYNIDGAWFNESVYKDAVDVIRNITRILEEYYDQIKI